MGQKKRKPIGLTHDYVTGSKFTTKTRSRKNLRCLCVVFTRVFFSSLLPREFIRDKICNLHFKARLGGEICLSNDIMRKGYSN